MSIDLLEPGTRSGGEREPSRPLSPSAPGRRGGPVGRHNVGCRNDANDVRDVRDDPVARIGVMVAATLIAGLPFVIDPRGWYVYVQLRWLVSAVLVCALVVLAWLSLRNRARHDRPDVTGQPAARVRSARPPSALVPAALPPTSLWWGLLFVVAVLSALLSSSPVTALAGAQDRMFGASTWIVHAGCALAAATVVRRRHDLVLLARGMAVGLLGVSLFTIAQRGGWDPASGASSFSRPGGPFGNADMLGAYCVLAVLVTIAVVLDRDESDRWRLFAMAAATLGLATLVLSGSRASWIATALGLVVLLGAAVRSRGLRVMPALAVCSASLVFCVGIGVAADASGRFDDLTGGTTEGRVHTWARAVDTLAQRPVLGWGEEGFAQGFTGSVDAAFEQDYGRRLTPDRAHNGLLDIATTLGLVGLVAYLGVLVATGRRIIRLIRADGTDGTDRGGDGSRIGSDDRSAGSSGHAVLPLGIAVALGAYLVQQQALFPLADVDALAWLLAGSLVGLSTTVAQRTTAGQRTTAAQSTTAGAIQSDRGSDRGVIAAEDATPSFIPRRGGRVAGAASVVLVAVVLSGVVTVGATQFIADRHARLAADEAVRGNAVSSLEAARAALRLTPGQVLDTLLLTDAALATGDADTIEATIGTVDQQRRIGFDDGRLTLAQARLLIAFHDLSLPNATASTPSRSALTKAIDLLGELLRGDGARSEAWLMLGDAMARSGDTAMAVDSWQHAASLRPDSLEPRLRLLDNHVVSGRWADAREVLAQIDRIGEPSSSTGRFDLMMLRAGVLAAS